VSKRSWEKYPRGGWRCSRCKSWEDTPAGKPRKPCDCCLPTVRGKSLVLHDEPEQWPYASAGQDPATVGSLSRWLRSLPKSYLDEIKAGLR
jgi:hypothetical protein